MSCMNASTVRGVNWSGYVESVTKDGPTAIAARISVSPPSVGRWWGTTQRPRPEHAAAFARAYSRPVLEAFIAAGFLSPEEAGERPSAPPSLASLSNDELLDAVRARMNGGSDAGDAEAQKNGDDDGGVGAVRKFGPKKPGPGSRRNYKRERLDWAALPEEERAAVSGGQASDYDEEDGEHPA